MHAFYQWPESAVKWGWVQVDKVGGSAGPHQPKRSHSWIPL